MAIWKVIGKFKYKGNGLDYSADIRLRKFKLVCKCGGKGGFRRDSKMWSLDEIKKYEIGSGRCFACGKPKQPYTLYCAYVSKAEEFIDVAKLLNFHTAGRWKYLTWRRFSKAVLYSGSLEGLYALLDTPVHLSDKMKKKISVSLELKRITEVELDECVLKSENNRLLREL